MKSNQNEADDLAIEAPRLVLPVLAKSMNYGAPIWFIVDANGTLVCQIKPSQDEAMCRHLVALINAGENAQT